jgi:CheY-like chemotaxis protein
VRYINGLWANEFWIPPMSADMIAPQEQKPSTYRSLAGKRILVVEDEPVVSVDYLFKLKEVGARAEAFLPTNALALSFLETHPVDAVIVDYLLRDGTSESLMGWLRDHGVPFIVVSAWVEKLRMHTSVVNALEKPVARHDLWQALSDAIDGGSEHRPSQ